MISRSSTHVKKRWRDSAWAPALLDAFINPMRLSRALFGGLVVAVLAACSFNPFSGTSSGGDEPIGPLGDGGTGRRQADGAHEDVRDNVFEVLPDPFAGLPSGPGQTATACSRGQTNAVTRGLCSNPTLTGLKALQNALGLTFTRTTSTGQNGQNGNPAFALLGHSSSLVAREVSAINPRAFVFTSPAGRGRVPGFVVTGFARGEPFVEIAAHDTTRDRVDFYLVKFDLPCTGAHTCTPGDLLTPNVESGWIGWTLYGEEDLKNNILDCRHCHETDGPGSKMGLRMQEFKDPWTHWMRNDKPGGIALLVDYLRAHGDQEDYGGIPAALIQKSDGLAMEDLVAGNGFGNQPNVFPTQTIESEVKRSASAQPEVNDPPGTSNTWNGLYARAVSGEMIPPPYHDVKVTDADKLAFATAAYQQFRGGQLAASELPDIRRVFLDKALPNMSLRPKVGATGREIINHMCAQCHNPNLDQTISRARFDVTKIDSMTDAQRSVAIARMRMPQSEIGKMPPAFMRSIPDDQLELAIQALGH